MNYVYEITDNNEVLIRDEDNPMPDNKPILFQPFNPTTGIYFSSKIEAETWAKSHVETLYELKPDVEPDTI